MCYHVIMNDLRFNDQFVKKYSDLIYAAIKRRLKGSGFNLPHEEILDIQQEVFASMLEDDKLGKVLNAASVPYWIAIVSGNAAMQYMRRRRRVEPKNVVSLFDTIGETEISELIPSSVLMPSEKMCKDEVSAKIDDAIESLEIKEKLIIKLNLMHDKKYEEIAEMLKIPRGTVASYVKRAKEKLKKRLEKFK